MPRLTEDIPAWAGRYVGIEFAERGRDRDGVDCWGLLRLVYAERYGIFLPSHHDGYADTKDAPGVAAVLEAELRGSGNWRPVLGDPDAGDALLFRAGAGHLWHVGVAISRGRMLHCRRGCDSCVERWDVGAWAPRLEGAFRFAGPIRLVGRTHPLRPDRIQIAMPAGGTIADMLTAAAVQASPFLRVWVGDVEIPHDAWARVRPKAGRTISVVAVPAGGGGKSPLRLILSIAVVALGAWIPGALPASWGLVGKAGLTFAGAMVAAGTTLAGTLLINALIPPPKSRLSDNASDQASPTITGARNEARQFGPVPVVLGEHRQAPLYGAAPYTEIVGDDQYLRLLFVPGYGPLELTDFKIGETPLSEYNGVEIEVREGRDGEDPISIYPGVVHEQAESTLLNQAAGWVTRTSHAGSDELSIDVTFPQGLAVVTSDGTKSEAVVALEVEYTPAGAGSWAPVNGGSPDFSRGLDFMFRTPEVAWGGEGTHAGEVAWGEGFAGPKPAYLPASSYSWEASGYVYVDPGRFPGTYGFGVDCSDAGEISINGRIVASWYGSHGTAGAATPDYEAHSGTISLRRGWHAIRIRVEARTTAGAIAVGWKRPGDAAFANIPAESFSLRAGSGPSLTGRLAYRWFDTSVYRNSFVVRASRTDQIRRCLAWAVPHGQYDVRVRRVTPDAASQTTIDQVYLTAVRSITAEDPISLPGVAKIAIRIKATDQLNGVVDQFNCMSRSILPDWDSASEEWVERATRNPASCYRAVLQGRPNARPIADDRLDLAELQAWHEACEAAGFEFNAVLDFAGTVWERLADVAATGRASFGMRDGRYSIVRDMPQTVPTQHFTPRNSYGFRGRKAFPDLPHALRIRYLNRDAGYQQDERTVYDDGYDETNASKFETLELFGVTASDQVWKLGRYHIAVARLRPEVYELSTDIEHLACTRGDLVLVTHDVPMWGLTFGRIVGLVTDEGGNLVGLRTDEQVTMDAGDRYVLRVRLQDGTSWLRSVTTVEGQATVISLDSPVAPGGDAWPAVGDLWMFGRLGHESRELIVKAVDIDKDLGATLTLVDHAPAVHTSDQGPIPPYDPGISQPPAWQNRPDTPVIESIRSDDLVMIRDADGSLRPRMLITLRRPSGTRPIPNAAQVQLRPIAAPGATGEGPWIHLPLIPIAGGQVSVERVEEGITYQLKLRTVTDTGLASLWVEAEHTVIGKVAPPPDVAAFDVVRLSDGTRRYSWALTQTPPDLDGFVIRAGPGGQGLAWEQLTPIHVGILQSSPSDMNAPTEGLWTLGIKAIDTSGNYSVNALLIDRALGEESLEGVAVSDDCGFAGWPGTKDGCHVTAERSLEADDETTWDRLGSSPFGTWAAWTRWVASPHNPISYTHTLDAGLVLSFSPDASAAADGELTLEACWSVDGVSYSDYAPIADARAATVSARFLRVRATVRLTGAAPIPTLRRLLVMMRATPVRHEIQDLDTSTLGGAWRSGAGDVRLPVPPGRFRAIRSVSLSFNGMGPGWSWEMVDRSSADALELGPRVRVYDGDHLPADAIIDAVITGF